MTRRFLFQMAVATIGLADRVRGRVPAFTPPPRPSVSRVTETAFSPLTLVEEFALADAKDAVKEKDGWILFKHRYNIPHDSLKKLWNHPEWPVSIGRMTAPSQESRDRELEIAKTMVWRRGEFERFEALAA